MRHLDTEQLLDLADARGSAAAGLTRASVHAQSCSRCGAELEGWRRLLGLLAEGPLPAPSREAHRRALAAFDAVRSPGRHRSPLAVLLLDTRLTPVAAVRDAGSAGTFRQSYRLGDLRVELFWERFGSEWNLVGSTDPPPAVCLSLRVEEGGRDRRVSIDALGEFRVEGIRGSLVRLVFLTDDGEELSLPPVELPDA